MYRDFSKEEEFYNKEFYFSYSSISTLLYHPICFYNNYILNQKEIKTSDSLLEGKIVHSLILEREKFKDNYVISNVEFPSANNKIIIDKIYKLIKNDEKITSNLNDYKDLILEELKLQNLHQKLVDDKDKTGDEKRVSKIVDDIGNNYFNYLLSSQNKIVISQDMYNRCLSAADTVLDNKLITKILGINQYDVEVYNEKELKVKIDTENFGLKGIIDNFVIDSENKVIRINDVKTTSKELINFKESIEYYKYWIQAIIYSSLVLAFLKENKEDYSDYSLQFYFIVIDKYNMCHPFKVSPQTLEEWTKRFNEVLKVVKFHYDKNRYDIYYEIECNNFTL